MHSFIILYKSFLLYLARPEVRKAIIVNIIKKTKVAKVFISIDIKKLVNFL